jgi:hypothetical protein
MTTWTVTETISGEVRIVAQGLTREFAERVVERPRQGTATFAMHPVKEMTR